MVFEYNLRFNKINNSRMNRYRLADKSEIIYVERQEQQQQYSLQLDGSNESKHIDLQSSPRQQQKTKTNMIGIVIFLVLLALILFFLEENRISSLKKRIQQFQLQKKQSDEQPDSKGPSNIDKIKLLQNDIASKDNKISHLQQQIFQFQKSSNRTINPNIVNFQYEPNTQSLPINPAIKDSQQKSIADVLYVNQQVRTNRQSFIRQRINFLNGQSSLQSSHLIKYNMIRDEQMLKQAILQNEKEWLRLDNKFKISSVKQELPICIISASYNNNANFRIEANLNSVFSQNYTNFKHVIINDASTDGSDQAYRSYFSFYKINKNRFTYIANKNRKTALENIYHSALYQCSKDSIVLILDGDDEIIGRNTFNLFNWGFQTKKSGVLYSNFYFYRQSVFVRKGFTSQYLQNEKKTNIYRQVPMKISHLRAARAQLFHQINPKDLKQGNGEFFKINADIALFFPLMELSCGRVNKIEEQFNLAYIVETGLNDYTLNPKQQGRTHDKIIASKRYQCYKDFDQRMKK